MLEFLTLCKTFAHTRLTASGIISKGPALVFSAHVVAGTEGPATAALYDSHGVLGEPITDLAAAQSSTHTILFIPPICFDQGVYLEVGENVTSVLLQYRQTRDLARLTKTQSLKSYLPSWLGGPTKERKST